MTAKQAVIVCIDGHRVQAGHADAHGTPQIDAQLQVYDTDSGALDLVAVRN